ncbi:MAG: hypothetical protein QGD94_03195, partial [Planctomycetia bacterium]|nr:hypothetical protein [Planctomycetia bacterium]
MLFIAILFISSYITHATQFPVRYLGDNTVNQVPHLAGGFGIQFNALQLLQAGLGEKIQRFND